MRYLAFCFAIALSVAAVRAGPIVLGQGSQPRLVSDGVRYIGVVFGRKEEILISDSLDGGITFNPPRTVVKVEGMPLGMRRGPRVALNAKTMVVTAIERDKGQQLSGDLWAWSSSDRGTTWIKASKPLNTVPGSAREGLDGLSSNLNGTVACVWLDLRNASNGVTATEVWIAVSDDGGLTWQSDRVAYRLPAGSVCECCHPSVVVDSNNSIHVMFRNAKDGARDQYITTSRDGGKTFSSAQKLGDGSWLLNACPMDGGDIAAAGTGDVDAAIQTVWMRNGQIFSAALGKEETLLGPGHQPVIASTSKGPWFGWINSGSLMVRWPDGKPKKIADDANYPSAVAWGKKQVGVAWQDKDRVHFQLIDAP